MNAWIGERRGWVALAMIACGCARSGLELFGVEENGSGGTSLGGRAGSAGSATGGALAGGTTTGGATSGGSTMGGTGALAGAGRGGEAPMCDRDGDGHLGPSCRGDDCDDDDASIHPGAWDTNAVPGPWITEFVMGDIAEDSRGKTSLAVDSSGASHVAEGRFGLRYATDETGVWVSEEIDPASRGVPSLALAPDETVAIAYTAPNEIRLATLNPSGWEVTSVTSFEPPDSPSEGACSLAIDRDGVFRLVYLASGRVWYATRSTGAWTVQGSFPASERISPRLVLDGPGTPHWLYAEPEDAPALRYATQCEGGFCASYLVSGPVLDADLTVDAAGSVHVVYGLSSIDSPLVHGVVGSDGRLTEDTIGPATSWSVEVQAPSTESPFSLFLAFLTPSFDVMVGRRDSSGWSSERVVNRSGYGVSLALEGSEVVHLTHTDFNFSVNTFVSHVTNRRLERDGIDQNCDGVDGVDRDGDGYASIRTGGTDCDDRDPRVHPSPGAGGGPADCD
jgi:hypothetical protein